MKILLIAFMGILGAAMGSFACCQAWRIWYKEHRRRKKLGKRSVCLSCGKKLEWYENIPLVSWLIQGGKCRKCGAKIGAMEIWSEVAGMVMFGLLGWKMISELGINGLENIDWMTVVKITTFLVGAVGMLILGIYDAKWGELPVKILWIVCAMAGIYSILNILMGGDWLATLETIGLLAGIYYLLYKISNEKLVGGGDWILCFGIALFLGDPWLGIWTLFLANFFGAVIMLPQKKKKVAFGPFLIGAFTVVYTLGEVLLKMRV